MKILIYACSRDGDEDLIGILNGNKINESMSDKVTFPTPLVAQIDLREYSKETTLIKIRMLD